MIFPAHFTQTQRTSQSLTFLANDLENAAAAIRAVLAGNSDQSTLDTIKQHTDSEGYHLTFGTLAEVRCFSCGAMNWGLQWSYHGCPTCTKHNEENRFCPSCEQWYPLTEFKGSPYYCHQSEGMETPEDDDLCRECRRDENERRKDERDAEEGFSQRAYEDHLQEMADHAADEDDY